MNDFAGTISNMTSEVLDTVNAVSILTFLLPKYGHFLIFLGGWRVTVFEGQKNLKDLYQSRKLSRCTTEMIKQLGSTFYIPRQRDLCSHTLFLSYRL